MDENTVNTTEPETTQQEGPTVEDLLAEIASLKGEGAKNKNALDKALREKGEVTKQLRARQTAEEAEAAETRAQAQAQAERIAQLEHEVAMNKAVNRYLSMGMERTLAEATAEAEISGDMDTVTANFNKVKEAAVREAKAEWLKSRPGVNTGSGGKEITAEEFNKMSIAEKTKLNRENPELYKQLRRGGN